jgi:glycosyltransferase involved in cell wall biosynthesis
VTQGLLIPVYNHGKTALPLAEKFSSLGLALILVDDGSGAETREYLARAAALPGVVLVRLDKNRGKGGAVSAGIDRAHELGLTHVLQLDADGQHDADRALFFLEQSRLHPEALICAYPEYDGSVPESRRSGRKVANTWAHIVTLSRAIPDVMCGFRVYPVEPVWRLIHRRPMDQRMGFDIEVLIRLFWKRVPFWFYPVAVRYPAGNVSNFHLVRDNIRISWLFTRLFFGMLWRLPGLLLRPGVGHR